MTRPVAIARLVALAACVWCLLVVSPPLLHGLESHVAETFVRITFAPICHQIASRSFAFDGTPMGVCARCLGLYAGFLTGALSALLLTRTRKRLPASPGRYLLVAAAFPTLAQWSLATAGLLSDSAAARAATSSLFGIVFAFFILSAIDSLLREARQRRKAPMGGRLDAAETT